MKITNKDCKSKQEINIENYLTKKKIQIGNIEEIDIKICLKKINKNTNREYRRNRYQNMSEENK